MHEITERLKAWSNGDQRAFDGLVPLVDKELRKIAHKYMRNERAGHVLQTTALVHEALIKLIRENVSWENRKHFYGLVARRMRQVLIDHARRGMKGEQIDVANEFKAQEKSKELILLDEALTKLAKKDERKATMVESRYFIGLTDHEIAEFLGVSTKTVERDWKFARSWLKRQMTG